MYECVNRIFVVSMLISIMLSLYRVHNRNRNRNHNRSALEKYFIECGFVRFHFSAFQLWFHIHFSEYARSARFCCAVYYCNIHPKTTMLTIFCSSFFICSIYSFIDNCWAVKSANVEHFQKCGPF